MPGGGSGVDRWKTNVYVNPPGRWGGHSHGCSVNFLLPLIAAQLEGRQAVTWEAGRAAAFGCGSGQPRGQRAPWEGLLSANLKDARGQLGWGGGR